MQPGKSLLVQPCMEEEEGLLFSSLPSSKVTGRHKTAAKKMRHTWHKAQPSSQGGDLDAMSSTGPFTNDLRNEGGWVGQILTKGSEVREVV